MHPEQRCYMRELNLKAPTMSTSSYNRASTPMTTKRMTLKCVKRAPTTIEVRYPNEGTTDTHPIT